MTDLSREPREAIIACYAAMERELAHVPGAVPRTSIPRPRCWPVRSNAMPCMPITPYNW